MKPPFLILAFIYISNNIFGHVIIQSKSFYLHEDKTMDTIINSNYSRLINFDILNTPFQSYKFYKHINTIKQEISIFSVQNNNDTICSYFIKLLDNNSIKVIQFTKTSDSNLHKSISTFYFKNNIHVFFNTIDYPFINQLSKYYNPKLEDKDLMNFDNDFFYFYANKKYHVVYNNLYKEIDSVFDFNGKEYKLYNVQEIKIIQNQIISCKGYYLDSFNQIVEDKAEIIKGKFKISNGKVFYSSYNILSKENIILKLRNGLIQSKKTKSTNLGGYEFTEYFSYKVPNKVIISNSNNKLKRIEQKIQIN